MPDMKRSLAYLCLKETKLSRSRLGQRLEIEPAPQFKRYAVAEKIPLPREFSDAGEPNLWELLQSRRSRRTYSQEPISLHQLAALCWAAQGITAKAGEYYLRTAPSAGALYPIETYIAANRVDGLPKGLFHFDVTGFQLECLAKGDFIQQVAEICLGQGFIKKASTIFIFSAIHRRTMAKYGNRGLRYIFMDAGHIAQNLLLAAEALKLKACPVAALFDDEMNNLLDLDGEEETAIYLVAIGT